MRGVRVCLLGLDIRAELLRVHSIVQGLFSVLMSTSTGTFVALKVQYESTTSTIQSSSGSYS